MLFKEFMNELGVWAQDEEDDGRYDFWNVVVERRPDALRPIYKVEFDDRNGLVILHAE